MRRHRRGYTLVEMLLATALCSVLLSALWMLMSTYGELFDKGQQQVERTQLCRALLEQMADDLRSAIQDPLPGTADETAGAAPRRRFGLAGTARELRFDVLQLTPTQGNPIPVGRTAGRSVEAQAARVPELRTVHYTFFAPDPGDELSEPGPQGLVRTELDFETPIDSAAAGLAEAPPREVPSAASAVSAERPGEDPEADADDTRLSVPEVVALQFRYFDGRGWTDGWNSLERKSLPAAVEIQLQIASVPSTPARRRAGANSGTPDGPAPGTDALEDAPSVGETGPDASGPPRGGATHRLIVDLPGSPNYRPPPAQPQLSASEPARPPVRRIAPPRWTRPASGPAPALPEDWIRTGSR